MKKLFSVRSNLQTRYYLKLNFQKLDQHTGVKWLIHDTKHRKDNDNNHNNDNNASSCSATTNFWSCIFTVSNLKI